MKQTGRDTCSCIRELQLQCSGLLPPPEPTYEPWSLSDPEFGKIAYTISILLMFSFVIVLLMVRSIRRTNSGVEVGGHAMEALLDAMRFREELDIQERQRRRLMKAKNKVTAWLTKTHGDGTAGTKGWRSSPNLIQPRKYTSSTVSEIPEIVVTEDAPLLGGIRRPHTPCLSLIYDFSDDNHHRESIDTCITYDKRFSGGGSRASICSEVSLGVGSRESLTRASQSLDRDSTHPPRLSIDGHSLSLG